MCYGHPTCPHEIRWGRNAGECGKRKRDVCPEMFESEDLYYEYMNEHDPWEEAAWEEPYP